MLGKAEAVTTATVQAHRVQEGVDARRSMADMRLDWLSALVLFPVVSVAHRQRGCQVKRSQLVVLGCVVKVAVTLRWRRTPGRARFCPGPKIAP